MRAFLKPPLGIITFVLLLPFILIYTHCWEKYDERNRV